MEEGSNVPILQTRASWRAGWPDKKIQITFYLNIKIIGISPCEGKITCSVS